MYQPQVRMQKRGNFLNVDGRELQVFLPNNDYFDNIIICWYIFTIALGCVITQKIYLCLSVLLLHANNSLLGVSFYHVSYLFSSTWDFCIVHSTTTTNSYLLTANVADEVVTCNMPCMLFNLIYHKRG